MKLYAHQQSFVEKSPDKYMLIWSMRLGKTVAAILWAKNKNQKTLIICPNFIVEQWREECRIHSLLATVISKDQFKIHHKELKGYKTVIVDEIHQFANPTSQLSKTLSSFLIDIPYVLGLTGTPYTSTNWCVWQYGIYMGRWDKKTFNRFREVYFRIQYFGQRGVWVSRADEKSKEKLAKLIRSFGETLKTEDVFDLPPHLVETVFFKETKKQTALKDSNEEIHPLSRFTALHQIEANEGDKDEWLIDLCTKEDKVIIVCRYTEQIKRLASLIPNSLVITGETKDKKGTVDKAESLDKCVVIVQATMSMGYGLPSFGTMVFASLDWSFTHYDQMLARNKGPKQLSATTTYVLLTKDGVDCRVWECVSNKRDFTAQIYEK